MKAVLSEFNSHFSSKQTLDQLNITWKKLSRNNAIIDCFSHIDIMSVSPKEEVNHKVSMVLAPTLNLMQSDLKLKQWLITDFAGTKKLCHK